MKTDVITCEVIQDLLPLYKDGCCSEQSGRIVEEHLAECESCRKKSEQFEEKLPLKTIPEEADLAGIRQGIGRIKRWKVRGIAALCLILCLFLIVIPVWNYVRGQGLTYANLKAAYIAYSFEKALIGGDYEKAYGYLDIETHYEDLLATNIDALIKTSGEAHAKAVERGIQEIEEKGYDWYNQVCKDKFMQSMNLLEEMGEMLGSCSNSDIEKQSWGWLVNYSVRTSSGHYMIMQLQIDSGGIAHFSPLSVWPAHDAVTGEVMAQDELKQKTLVYDRLYREPAINETVMEILYGDTDYDWTGLFSY